MKSMESVFEWFTWNEPKTVSASYYFTELLITAGGENVAPVPIENDVKEALPQVSNCMLIGDKRKFLSMLISLKVSISTLYAERIHLHLFGTFFDTSK